MFNSTITDIAKQYRVNRAVIQKWIETGRLNHGVEYIDLRLPGGRRANLRFNKEAVDKFFATSPENR